jgi:hypothetical protein
MPELLDPFLQKKIKPAPVLIIGEDVLPAVASHHHVIYSVCIMQPGF